MRKLLFCLFFLPLTALAQSSPIAFAIHGGAGFVDSNKVSPELRARYRMVLTEASLTGYGILKRGGTSLEAVEAAIRILEDSPLFNAGRGAVTNAEGFCELDASIMDGSKRQAGAVAGLTTVKNPITLARLVKDSTTHVLLMGEGAERFASQMPVERVERSYFLERDPDKKGEVPAWLHDAKFGTVGAVALDRSGNLAAGTSTGGMRGKKFGRVGDVPLIGAGTYAENGVVAVSCTGHGEFFIRQVAAYEVAALMKYKGMTVQQAADAVIYQQLKPIGGSGGLIALDAQGNIHLPFNSGSMFRASVDNAGKITVGIW
ncbi:MAG: beta-aspartyl-peptidase [Sphingobacteriaceae bacterium]|nr:beta-aspartyl-peptidase [Sphingobacteriaceae bacterium]